MSYTEDPFSALLAELENMEGDNAVSPPSTSSMEPMEYGAPQPAKKPKRTKKTAATQTAANNGTTSVWILRPAHDVPYIAWTDEMFQYTVQNPANSGDVLLKMQLFNRGRLTHGCDLYLDPAKDKKILCAMKNLLEDLENMWVDRAKGDVPKTVGMTQSAIPLSSWRVVNKEEDAFKDCATRAVSRSGGSSGGKKPRIGARKAGENNRPALPRNPARQEQ